MWDQGDLLDGRMNRDTHGHPWKARTLESITWQRLDECPDLSHAYSIIHKARPRRCTDPKRAIVSNPPLVLISHLRSNLPFPLLDQVNVPCICLFYSDNLRLLCVGAFCSSWPLQPVNRPGLSARNRTSFAVVKPDIVGYFTPVRRFAPSLTNGLCRILKQSF